MNSLMMVPLCVMTWTFTLLKSRAILSKSNLRERHTFQVVAMLLFFSIALTFMVVEFSAFFDTYTFPNISLLISHSSFLIGVYFATEISLDLVEAPAGRSIIPWIRALLFLVLAGLLIIYFLFVSKMPPTLFFVPQNPPEVIFKLMTCLYGIMLSTTMAITHLTYLPSKQSLLIRFRGMMVITAGLNVATYLAVRAIIFAAYFWPFLMSPLLVILSYVFLVSSTLFSCLALSSNKVYAQILLMVQSVDSWHAFQDLGYLVERLMFLCPIVGLPTNNPGFLRFLLNPEYYLYRAIILILDGRAMLSDFLSESAQAGPTVWQDDELLQEAIQIHQSLQSTNPPNDFYDIVEAYRRVSKDLSINRNYASPGNQG